MPLEDFLDQLATITVEPIPPRKDRTGGVDRTGDWDTVAADVPCLVRPVSAALQSRDDARRDIVIYRIYFASDPVDGGLSTRHRIAVGTQVYQITGVVNPNSLGRIIHCDCEAIKS